MISIEKNIPVPETRGNVPKYPLRDMAVGDSFALPRSKEGSVAAVVRNYGKQHGARFTVRRVSPELIRVWRVA